MQQLESWNVVSASIPPKRRHDRAVIYTVDHDHIRGLVRLWTDFIEGAITP